MIDLYSMNSQHSEDLAAVPEWCNETYNKHFAQYFTDQRSLFARLKSKQHPITNTELETILTTVPLQLFSVSEVLNKFRISQSVIKLKTKQKEREIYSSSQERTAAAKQAEASNAVLEDGLLYNAYGTVISRVDAEIAFSRELIMGAKKIWDARVRTETVHPVSPTSESSELPEYVPEHRNVYLK